MKPKIKKNRQKKGSSALKSVPVVHYNSNIMVNRAFFRVCECVVREKKQLFGNRYFFLDGVTAIYQVCLY